MFITIEQTLQNRIVKKITCLNNFIASNIRPITVRPQVKFMTTKQNFFNNITMIKKRKYKLPHYVKFLYEMFGSSNYVYVIFSSNNSK